MKVVKYWESYPSLASSQDSLAYLVNKLVLYSLYVFNVFLTFCKNNKRQQTVRPADE